MGMYAQWEKNVATIRLKLKEVNGRKDFFLFVKKYVYGIKIILPPFTTIISL